MADPVLHIQIVSDFICPWCFIGKRRLEQALEKVPGIEPVISWRPFFLDPEIPPEGVDREDYIKDKYEPEKAVGIFEAIREIGEEAGINFLFDRIERTPNTLDAHRLMLWAEDENCDADVSENLFVSYFLEGGDIGDQELLGDIAAMSGMDAERVREKLYEEEDSELVLQNIEESKAIGIKALPTFIINNAFVIAGAEQPELLAQALIKIADNQP